MGIAIATLVAMAGCGNSSGPTPEIPDTTTDLPGGGVSVVNNPPQGGFRIEVTADKTQGAAPLRVRFNASVVGGTSPLTYAWTFGDDTTSTEQNPAHVFSAVNTFEVKLTVTDADQRSSKIGPIVIRTRPSRTDLSILDVVVTSDTVQAGAAVSVQVQVANSGQEASEATRIAILLATSTTIDTTLPAIGYITLPAVAAAADTLVPSQPANITIPSSTAPGDYYLVAVADPDGLVSETNEGNNALLRLTPLRVGGTTSNVDLAVLTPSADRAAAFPGETVTVSYVVANNGTAAASAFQVKIHLSPDSTFEPTDPVVATESFTQIAGSQSMPKTTSFAIPSGTNAGNYTIFVVADLANVVAESTKANNRGDTPLRIVTGTVAGSELTVSNVTFDPSSVIAGGTVTVSYTVQNRGDTATGSFTNKLVLSTTGALGASPIQIGTDQVTAVAGAASVVRTSITATVPSGTTAGDYYLGVIADSTNAVTEVIETNNSAVSATKLTVRSQSAVDLVPTLVSATPDLVRTTDQISVSVNVSNRGQDAAGAFSVQVLLSPDATDETNASVLGTIATTGLAAGASTTLSQSFTVPTATENGELYVIAKVDPSNAVRETVETNNRVYSLSTVKVYGTTCASDDANEPNDFATQAKAFPAGTAVVVPNLLSCKTNDDWFKVTLGAGAFVNVAAKFKDSEGDIQLELYGPASSTTAIASSTGYSDYEQVYFKAAPVAGDYLVRVYHSTYDTTRSNNYTLFLTTGSGATGTDLTGNVKSISATNKLAGESFTVTFRTRSGNNSASNVGYTVKLSSTTTFDTSAVTIGSGTITSVGAAGTSTDLVETMATVTIPSATAQGDYYVGVILDSAGSITELDETNNTLIWPQLFRVGAACIDDAYEAGAGNDTYSTAPILGDGSTSLVMCGTDQDWFKIGPLKAGQQITVETLGATCSHDLYLYGPNGTTYVDSDWVSGSGNGLIQNPTITQAGYHYVKVYNYSSYSCQSGTSYTLRLTGTNAIDLTPRNATAQPRPVTAGEDLILDWTLENQGGTAAAASTVTIRLSTDQTIDTSDTLLATLSVPTVAGLTAVARRDKLTIPANTVSGDYYVGITVDSGGTIAESDETNNVLVVPIRVSAKCTSDSREGGSGNNLQSTANSISSSLPLSESLTICLADEDWFKVAVSTGEKLYAAACFTHANGDIDLDMYVPGQASPVRSAGQVDNEAVQYTGTATGTFYLRVYGVLGQVSNSYTLKVSKDAAPSCP